jgi:CHAT domain-containing protein
VSDYVVSSYVPTFDALLTPSSPSVGSVKVMVVAQGGAPSQEPLPWAQEELVEITKHVPRDKLLRIGTAEAPATVEDVLDRLPDVSTVHFACHARHDAKSVLDSGLILADDQVLRIRDFMKPSVPNARLAVLSVRSAAMGGGNVYDIPIHAAGALLSAGFRGVVVTMWCVSSSLSSRRQC